MLGFSSIIRDITDRRQWEERQKLMARELVHRVKNSFAVVQSIVRQTQRSTPDPEAFAQAFSGRLAAMAASHDLLTDRHWEGAACATSFRASSRRSRRGPRSGCMWKAPM